VISREDATGIDSVVLSSEYSITRNTGGGGTVVFDTAPASGQTIYTRLNPDFVQDITFPNGVAITSLALERVADQSVARDQFLAAEIARAIKVPVGETGATLPPAAFRAGKYQAFDAEGNPVAVSGTGDSGDFLEDLALSTGASLIGFLQSGANADPESVETALRREVWADQYKLAPDADDTSCITRAVTALLAAGGGGVVRLSRRAYTINSTITFTALNNVRIIGAGKSNAGTMIRETFTSGDGIVFSACQSCELADVYFWPTVRKTSGFSAKLTGGSFDCRVDIRTDFGWNGLLIDGATETVFSVVSRYLLGTVGVEFTGSNSSRSFRAICARQISDNPYPASVAADPSNAKTFSGGMSLAVGDHFTANGAIWQCVQAGTAGVSAPSGYPAGTTPESVFNTDVDNGTAKLRYVANLGLTHLLHNNYAYSLVIVTAALLNGARGFAMEDSANTGSSFPIWTFVLNLECDHSYVEGVDLSRGEGFFSAGILWSGSCLSGNGILIGPNYRGNVTMGNGTRCFGNAQHGILRQPGPVDIRFDGCESTDNSIASSATYHGLQIAAGSEDTHVDGGRYGDSPSVSGNQQGYGISIGDGCDQTHIGAAYVRGNVTGTINIGAGQTNMSIDGCPGYNNEASASAVSVGASPYTYTNATGAKVSLTITGGTVSSVTLGGDQIASATGTQVLVPAGGSVVITYSSAPTVKAQRL
jgi:hypothetical protein